MKGRKQCLLVALATVVAGAQHDFARQLHPNNDEDDFQQMKNSPFSKAKLARLGVSSRTLGVFKNGGDSVNLRRRRAAEDPEEDEEYSSTVATRLSLEAWFDIRYSITEVPVDVPPVVVDPTPFPSMQGSLVGTDGPTMSGGSEPVTDAPTLENIEFGTEAPTMAPVELSAFTGAPTMEEDGFRRERKLADDSYVVEPRIRGTTYLYYDSPIYYLDEIDNSALLGVVQGECKRINEFDMGYCQFTFEWYDDMNTISMAFNAEGPVYDIGGAMEVTGGVGALQGATGQVVMSTGYLNTDTFPPEAIFPEYPLPDFFVGPVQGYRIEAMLDLDARFEEAS